jgi:hypothetical protein
MLDRLPVRSAVPRLSRAELLRRPKQGEVPLASPANSEVSLENLSFRVRQLSRDG